MKLHALRIVLLIVVAVDALAILLEATEHIIIDNALVIVFQASLIDGQSLITDKGREDQTVTQIAVDTIR